MKLHQQTIGKFAGAQCVIEKTMASTATCPLNQGNMIAVGSISIVLALIV